MFRIELSLIVLAALGCSAGDDVPAPLIASVSPNHAAPGASVMIVGDFFCQNPDAGDEEAPGECANSGTVSFGSTPANVGMYSEHAIMVEVPNVTPGPVDVRVTAAGRTSNDVEFRVEMP